MAFPVSRTLCTAVIDPLSTTRHNSSEMAYRLSMNQDGCRTSTETGHDVAEHDLMMMHADATRNARLRFSLVAIDISSSPHFAHEERANCLTIRFCKLRAESRISPVPRGPEITRAEMLAQSHVRAERGATCYRMGRCRLPNSYLYDKEIIPRVKKAIRR